MGQYAEFKHICFMDTLDHSRFSQKQSDLYSMTVENTDRINRQNNHEIFVIIGNPPYNANQQNENENNKNREYEEVDKRIRATYIKESTAQKTKLYDMYARFFRWATDRIGDKEGIVAFITNSSFIDARTFDGFRKVVSEEFDEIYIVDLGGNVRANPKLSGPKNNVFAIQTGVAISFMVKYKNRRDSLQEKHKRNLESDCQCRIFYHRRPEIETAKEKLVFLSNTKFEHIEFNRIEPDNHHNWINLSDNDFDDLLPLVNKETKSGKAESAVFRLFSGGINTARDEWNYDFDFEDLISKVNFFIKEYNSILERFKTSGLDKVKLIIHNKLKIKTTLFLEQYIERGISLSFKDRNIRQCLYRPYILKTTYFSEIITHSPYLNFIIFPNKESENILIIFTAPGSQKDFSAIVSNRLVDFHVIGAAAQSQCLPFYRYEANETRIDNITNWGLQQFRTHYKNRKITKENIFHYVYAVLHNPEYRKKYEQNLKRELPRIPFYEDFQQWVKWGKELMNLHIGFESVDPYPLERRDVPDNSPKVKLKIDKENGAIIIDTATSLNGVPKTAWEYKLGTYCALQWILEQYKEKKIKDPTVAEKFNTYCFADYKEKVIDLLLRVCTVSVRTMEIVREMEKLS